MNTLALLAGVVIIVAVTVYATIEVMRKHEETEAEKRRRQLVKIMQRDGDDAA